MYINMYSLLVSSSNNEGLNNQDQNSSSVRPLSIEGPSTSSNEPHLQPVPNQPRQPSNLQGLLKYAMDAAQSEDANNKASVYPLDEEVCHLVSVPCTEYVNIRVDTRCYNIMYMLQKKTFLKEALSSLTVNVIDELQKAVHTLSNVSNLRIEDDVTEYENALETIVDLVDRIDVANDVYKIGGFSVFKPCLNSSHSSIRWRMADIIAELAQNNPFCQEKLLEIKVFPMLLHMIDKDSSEQARIKALYAVSCKWWTVSLRYKRFPCILEFMFFIFWFSRCWFYLEYRYSPRSPGIVEIHGWEWRLFGTSTRDAELGGEAADQVSIFTRQFVQQRRFKRGEKYPHENGLHRTDSSVIKHDEFAAGSQVTHPFAVA